MLATYHSSVLIASDFNIYCDVDEYVHADCLLDLLDAFGLQKHVDKSIHARGYTLDLIIPTVGIQLSNVYVDLSILSDHSRVTCTLPISS